MIFAVLLSVFIACCYGNSNPLGDDKKKPVKSDVTFGVVELDSVTFPIIVNERSPFATFLFMFHKSQIGDYMLDSLRYDYYLQALDFQKDCLVDNKILFAQIKVNGAQNKLLGDKYGLHANYRGPKIGIILAGSELFIPYDAGFSKSDFYHFIADLINVNVTYPFTTKHLNSIASKFTSTSVLDDEELLSEVSDELKLAVEQLYTHEKEQFGKYFVQTMDKIIHDMKKRPGSDANDIAVAEYTRLSRAYREIKQNPDSNVSNEKLKEIEVKRNIVRAFVTNYDVHSDNHSSEDGVEHHRSNKNYKNSAANDL